MIRGDGPRGRDMGEGSVLDEKTILARIREQLRAPLGEAPPPAILPRPQIAPDITEQGIQLELGAVWEATDVSDAPLMSYRRVIGPMFVLTQRIDRKLQPTPLHRQVRYNQ